MKNILYLFLVVTLLSCSDDQDSKDDLGKCGTDGVQYQTSFVVYNLKDILTNYSIEENDQDLYEMRYKGQQLFKLYKGACVSTDCEQKLYDLIEQLEADWSTYDDSQQSLKPQYVYMSEFLREYDNNRCY